MYSGILNPGNWSITFKTRCGIRLIFHLWRFISWVALKVELHCSKEIP